MRPGAPPRSRKYVFTGPGEVSWLVTDPHGTPVTPCFNKMYKNEPPAKFYACSDVPHTHTRTHTDAFTNNFTHNAFYTPTLLHTGTFAHKPFYPATPLTHKRTYTQTLLHTCSLPRGHFYTTTTFTHKHVYTQTLLHTNSFTHKPF